MKKLFLLLAAGFTVSSAMAQTVSTNPSKTIVPFKANPQRVANYNPAIASHSNSSTKNERTTTYDYNSWFDYFDANFVNPGYVLYFFEVFPDSNLINPANVSATSDGYIFTRGIGMSFDPSDNGYYTPTGVTSPGAPLLSSTAYNIDSFLCLDKYIRNNASAIGDSEIIDLIVVNNAANSGTYMESWASGTTYSFLAIDDTFRVADCDYMPYTFTPAQYAEDCWDSINTNKFRKGFALDAAWAADTDANGYHVTQFPVDSLYVPAGSKVVAYVHFKSGVNYPLGTSVASANYLHLFAGDPTGSFPVQSAGSYQTGLLSQNQTGYGFSVIGGHDALFADGNFIDPTAPPAAGSPFGFEVPLYQFHILWPGAALTTGVNSVKNITSVNAYPNPATDAVTISFHAASGAKVSISLTNMLSQVVATQTVVGSGNGSVEFNTSALPAGVYFYTLNANGELSTGRVVVAH